MSLMITPGLGKAELWRARSPESQDAFSPEPPQLDIWKVLSAQKKLKKKATTQKIAVILIYFSGPPSIKL